MGCSMVPLLLENFSYSAKKNTYEKNLLNPDNSL